MIEVLPLVFGFDRQELIANAGIVGGIAMALVVLAMLVVSVLPAYSESWAERIGTTDTTPAGPDLAEVVPGRDDPLAAPGAADTAAPDASADGDAESGSTAIPDPEIAGESGSDDGSNADSDSGTESGDDVDPSTDAESTGGDAETNSN